MHPVIEESWANALQPQFQAPWFAMLKQFLLEEKKHHTVYPPGNAIFAAFNHTPVDRVKVVILGQDPYHGPGQAHGLCFSVPDGIPIPPSLQNIFRELESDLGIKAPRSGNLTAWARQGVLLLNATLTVRAGQAASHQGKGWENFTDAAIRYLSDHREHLVFILWGSPAGEKARLIDHSKHLVLRSVHPSPLSAYRGFFGCRHFSAANAWLEKHHIEPVSWVLT
ncbi:MAG TPA: uracil-DNA glycosylase [Bacteroidales bacterium]|nr:uracil-DNA glycosylase [Bacteroidales bacterium]HRZ49638.1 uracil-DNA glycosylase [Bacteroidales bacterium]